MPPVSGPLTSVSVHILAKNGISRQLACRLIGLSDICLNFCLNDSIELLEILFDGREFHSLAEVGGETFSECFGRVYNYILKKLAVMIA